MFDEVQSLAARYLGKLFRYGVFSLAAAVQVDVAPDMDTSVSAVGLFIGGLFVQGVVFLWSKARDKKLAKANPLEAA